MTDHEKDVATLDAGTGRELGLSDDDFALLTEAGIPRVGPHFTTDIPEGPLGLFAVQPLDGDDKALFLGGTDTDGGLRYFLDIANGYVALLALDDDGETETEIVNTSLAHFLEFLDRLGAFTTSPPARDDRARLKALAADLEALSPESFRHPHCWWSMAIDQLRRGIARRDRESGPALSQSDAFDRALDRLYDDGYRLLTQQDFAAETDAYGLLTLPDDFSAAFSSEGALVKDVTFALRGAVTETVQAAFAREGLVLVVPKEEEDEDLDSETAMKRLMAAQYGPQTPSDGTGTCTAGDTTSDLCRIVKAFDVLASQGYVTEPALWPTTSGCWERVAERLDDLDSPKAVFWNTQNHNSAFDARGDLVGSLFLTWSGDRAVIAEALATAEVPLTVPEDDGTTFIFEPHAVTSAP